VLVGGEVVASKEKAGFIAKLFGGGGFPDEDAAVDAVKKKLAAAPTPSGHR